MIRIRPFSRHRLATLALAWWLYGTGQTAVGQEQAELETLLQEQPLDFTLSAGDVIELKFFFNPELDDTMRIRPDGKIALPLIGDVLVATKAVKDASAEIERLYRPHLRNPSVTVQVQEYISEVYVGGEVQRPGIVDMRRRLTLLEAVTAVGGRTPQGSTSAVLLVRKGDDGTPVVHKISMKLKDGEAVAQAGIPLRPFDVVLVPESGITKVNRWVDNYIRKMIPVGVNVNFDYIFSRSRVVIP